MPLRLTWQRTIIKCHGDRQTSLEKDLQMRCHYKISKKSWSAHKIITKNIKICLVSTFVNFRDNSFLHSAVKKTKHGAKEVRKMLLSD